VNVTRKSTSLFGAGFVGYITKSVIAGSPALAALRSIGEIITSAIGMQMRNVTRILRRMCFIRFKYIYILYINFREIARN